jgi:hypothetical protein
MLPRQSWRRVPRPGEGLLPVTLTFELAIDIARPKEEVFAFLRDKDQFPQPGGSPVLLLDKVTPGPAGLGTRYREVVQMLPWVRGEILSEITGFEPGQRLAEHFWGAGMRGHLAYTFSDRDGGTRLVQRETVQLAWFLKLFEPLFKRMLASRLEQRLATIKEILEGGWSVNL